MALITNIYALIETGDVAGAGTDGDVYAGVCGREFYINSEADDFERGSRFYYRFGENAGFTESPMVNPEGNDPRHQQLMAEDVDRFPVYIRFSPNSRDDNWNLKTAAIVINRDINHVYASLTNAPNGIWLGARFGLFLHLPRYIEPRPRPDHGEIVKVLEEVMRI